MAPTTNFTNFSNSYVYGNVFFSGLKAEKQLRNQNYTEDWALGCHPRDNGHVTH